MKPRTFVCQSKSYNSTQNGVIYINVSFQIQSQTPAPGTTPSFSPNFNQAWPMPETEANEYQVGHPYTFTPAEA
jgi:hypothetical protein